MKKILVLLLMLCCAAAVFADNVAMPRFAIPTAQDNGMGGTHVAYTDNVFSLLVNPAAMMRTEQRSFLALSGGLFNPVNTVGFANFSRDLANGFSTDNPESLLNSLGNVTDIISKQKGKITLGLDIREFPLSIAWVADGFGFGLWNRFFVNPNIIGTHVSLTAYSDVILPVGFAFKIIDIGAHSVDAGIAFKPFVRIKLGEQINILDMDSSFVDSMAVPLIAGVGFDAGLLYRWDIGLSAGLTFDDIITRGNVAANFMETKDTNSYYVPFSINAGLAYDFKIGRFWEAAPGFLAKTGFTLAVDWRDLTNLAQQDDYTKRNAILDFGAGVQLSIADVFKMRVGLNEMLPAVGLGFDLGPLKLDAAYYGKELGLEPGQLSTSAVDLTLALRPGAKKRVWPWTRRSLSDLFSGKKAEAETVYYDYPE